MNNENQSTAGFRFQSEQGDVMLAEAHGQLGIVNTDNLGEFGIYDRVNRDFTLYHNKPTITTDPVARLDFLQNPSLAYFYEQLESRDRSFVDASVAEVQRFLGRQAKDDYRNYRLSFDGCLREGQHS